MSSPTLRSRIAVLWVGILLLAGAASSACELWRGFTVHDADGRTFLDRWKHAADSQNDRVSHGFGRAFAPIEAAMRPDPPQACWVRIRGTSQRDVPLALTDMMVGRSLHNRFFPAQFDALPLDAGPETIAGRWLLDLDPSRPLAVPPDYERVAGSNRFTLWRPMNPAKGSR